MNTFVKFVNDAVFDPTPWSTAIVAILTALTTLIGAVAGFVKLLKEVRKNTALTAMGVVTGESSHQILTEQSGQSTNNGPQ